MQIANDEFQRRVVNYQKNPCSENEREVAQALMLLAENLGSYIGKTSDHLKDIPTEDLVYICLEKLNRFDASKGKAFNYFTTIMLCHLRQVYRRKQKYADLKKKYEHALAG